MICKNCGTSFEEGIFCPDVAQCDLAIPLIKIIQL